MALNNKLKKTPAIGAGDLEPISLDEGLRSDGGRAIISPVEPPVSTMSTRGNSGNGVSGVTNGNKKVTGTDMVGYGGGATGYGTLKDNDAFDRLTRRPSGEGLPYGYVGYNYGGTAYTADNYLGLTGAGKYDREWSGSQANSNMAAFLPQQEYDQARDLQSAINSAISSGDEATRKQLQSQLDDITGRYGFYVNSDGSIDAAMVYAGDQSAYLDGNSGRRNGFSIPTYESRYDPLIQELYQAILNREPFTYDPETDETYQQYKTSYTRNGQRAMQDTLGQVSSRTGGLASSYAASAAQQTYDNYMAALADKIPELRQLAYSMYQDELTNKRSDLSMLMDLDNVDYTRWADNRDFGYGVYRDDVSDNQWQQQFAYNAMRDAVSDSQWQQQFDTNNNQWQTQWDYNTQQDAWNRDYQLAQQYAELTGDYSGFLGAGWTQAQVNAANQAYQQQLAAAKSSGSSGGSSASKTSSANADGGGVDWSAVENYASQYGGDPETYIKANYRAMGFKSQTEALSSWEMYETMKDYEANGRQPEALAPRDFALVKSTVAQMKKNGYSDREIQKYIEKAAFGEEYINKRGESPYGKSTSPMSDEQLDELYRMLGW